MKRRKTTAIVLLIAMLVTIFPVAQSKPEPALAAEQIYIEGIGTVTIQHDNGDGYEIGLDDNKNLIVRGEYYSNSDATLSYHTTELYFTKNPTKSGTDYVPGNHMGAGRGFSVNVKYRHKDGGDSPRPGYKYDIYTVRRDELENMIKYIFGENGLKTSKTVYLSEGFAIRQRPNSLVPWNTSHVKGKTYDSCSGIRGAAGWSGTTWDNFENYYDIPITLNLVKHNVTVNTNPPGVANFAYYPQVYGGELTEVSTWAKDENKYAFTGWTVNSGGAVLTDPNGAYTTFTMPNNDVVLTANYAEKAKPPATKKPVPTLKPGTTPPPVTPEPTPVPPTKAPTPTPEPYFPSEDSKVYAQETRYYTTDAGHTMYQVYNKDLPLANGSGTKYNENTYLSEYYLQGTDGDGNVWNFKASGTNATYVHPYRYKGVFVDSANIKNIRELTFPSTITYNGTTYTVTSIGGGSEKYHEITYIPSYGGPPYENAQYSYAQGYYSWRDNYSDYASSVKYRHNSNIRVEYCWGVIGNGSITSKYEMINNWTQSGVTRVDNEYEDYNYYVYNTTLEYVTIPSTVTKIEDYAFYSCQALKSVAGGENVTSIGIRAFSGAPTRTYTISRKGFENRYDNYQRYYYNDSISYDNPTDVMWAWQNQVKIAEFCDMAAFPRLNTIGDYAFIKRDNLFNVKLSSTVSTIGQAAFSGCNLESIEIPRVSVSIADDVNTLGTKGSETANKTLIITVPSAANTIDYGLRYNDSYSLRAGHKVTYYNNATPSESYASSAELRPQRSEMVYRLETYKRKDSGSSFDYTNHYEFYLDSEGYLWRVPYNSNSMPTAVYSGTKFKELILWCGTSRSSGSSSYSYYTGCFAIAENGKAYGYNPETAAWTDFNIPTGSTGHTWVTLTADTYSQNSGSYSTTSLEKLVDLHCLYYLYNGKLYRKSVYATETNVSGYSSASGSSGGENTSFSCTFSSAPVQVSTNGTTITDFYVFSSSFSTSDGRESYSGTTTYAYTYRLPKIFAVDSSGKYLIGSGETTESYECPYNGTATQSSGFSKNMYDNGPTGLAYTWKTSSATGYKQIYDSNDTVVGSTNYTYYPPSYGSSSQQRTHESSYDNVYVIDKSGNLLLVRDIMATGSASNAIGTGSASTAVSGKNFTKMIPTESSFYSLFEDANGSVWVYAPAKGEAKKVFDGATVVQTKVAEGRNEWQGNSHYVERILYISDSAGRYWKISCLADTYYYDSGGSYTSYGNMSVTAISETQYSPSAPVIMITGYNFVEPLYDVMFAHAGYEFLGWNTKANGSGTGYQPGYDLAVTGPLSLYAQWGVAKNVIRYAPNGGNGVMTDEEYDASVTKVTLKENTFTRPGYEFTGWNTKADGSGASYRDKATITIPKGTTTLYAQWKPISYVIKVGKDDIREESGGFSQTVTLNTDQTFTVPGALEDKVYTITFDKNANPVMSTADTVSLTATSATASLAFYGWRLYEELPDGTYHYLDPYEPGDVIKNLTSKKNATLVLFPYWGGSASYVKLPEATCTGYDLAGFTTGGAYAPDFFDTEEKMIAAIEGNILIMAPNGSGAQYQPKKSETLYAYYQATNYIVDLVAEDKDADPGEITHTQNAVTMTFDEVLPSVAIPCSDRHIFMGYYDKLDADGHPTDDAKQYYDETGKALCKWQKEDVGVTTLYAYLLSEVEVTLDGRGATEQEQTTVTMTYDEVGPAVIPPKKTGYTFHGYYTDVRGAGKQYFDATGAGTAVWLEKKVDVLYAYWTQNPVERPEKEEIITPVLPPQESLSGSIGGKKNGVALIYSADEDTSTDCVTNRQNYYTYDTEGHVGYIPSTEPLGFRAKVPAYFFDYNLNRYSGIEKIKVVVQVPYRTQYEESDENLVISDLKYEEYTFEIPKAWTYWGIDTAGLYKADSVTVRNDALQSEIVQEVVWSDDFTVREPNCTLNAYEKGVPGHVFYDTYDSNGTPVKNIFLPEQYIISDEVGSLPDVNAYLSAVCQNAAIAGAGEFTVRSDKIELEGTVLMSDVELYGGVGASFDEQEAERKEEEFDVLTEYLQCWDEGIRMDVETNNGVHTSDASIRYTCSAGVGCAISKARTLQDINNLRVLTPVACNGAVISDGISNGENVAQTESGVLTLREELNFFTVEVKNTGNHIQTPGYAFQNYLRSRSGRMLLKTDIASGLAMNLAKFDFDVFYDLDGNSYDVTSGTVNTEGDLFVPAGEWVIVGEGPKQFYVSGTVTEGTYEVDFMSVAVNCPISDDGMIDSELIEDYVNADMSKYVAKDSFVLEIEGCIKDVEYLGSDDASANDFPLMKLGYTGTYSVSTVGSLVSKSAEMNLTPTFYWLSEDSKERLEIDVYYADEIEGELKYFVDAGGSDDGKNVYETSLTDPLLRIPEGLATKTKSVLEDNAVTDDSGVVYAYHPYALDLAFRMLPGLPLTNTPMYYCGVCREAALTKKGLTCSHASFESTGIEESAKVALQTWYMEYKLQPSTRAVIKGTMEGRCDACSQTCYFYNGVAVCDKCGLELSAVKEFSLEEYGRINTFSGNEKFFVQEGFLVVNLSILARNDDGTVRTYDWKNNALAKEWEEQGYLYMPGDVLLYYADRTVGEDYHVGGVER